LTAMASLRLPERPVAAQLVTVTEFASLARLSRRQIDRLRKRRPAGFPCELELGSGASKHHNCPRFKLSDVQKWLDSRALW
jgi:predicted DNA-binding transcriptional regulator AlpA